VPSASFPLRHTECAYYYKRRARVPVLHDSDVRAPGPGANVTMSLVRVALALPVFLS